MDLFVPSDKASPSMVNPFLPSQVQHLDNGLVSRQGEVLEQLFDLLLSVLEVIQGKFNKQFDVIV